METKEVIRIIEEDLDEIAINDAILAVCRAYDRTNEENELTFVALPKHSKKKREQVIQWFCEMARKNNVKK